MLRGGARCGVTFLDTADVYGDGRSERLVGRFLRERGDDLSRGDQDGPPGGPARARELHARELPCLERPLAENLGVDTLDLVQLHCPPTAVLRRRPGLRRAGRARRRGPDRRLRRLGRDRRRGADGDRPADVATVQIILNAFRRKPLERVLPAAPGGGWASSPGCRWPSGCSRGKYDEHTTFAADDHRTYNRPARRSTSARPSAGVPFDVGLAAARELARADPAGATTAQLALRWIVDQPGVTTVIPGARNAEQARANAAAADLAPLDRETLAALREVYDRDIREHVHDRW